MASYEELEAQAFLDKKPAVLGNFDPAGYRKLVSTLGGLKDSLGAERESIELKLQKLAAEKAEAAGAHKVIQAELGRQVTAANKGYASILKEYQLLHRQYGEQVVQHERFEREVLAEREEAKVTLWKAKHHGEVEVAKLEVLLEEARESVKIYPPQIAERDVVIGQLRETLKVEVEKRDDLLEQSHKETARLALQIEDEKEKYAQLEVKVAQDLASVEQDKKLCLSRQKNAEQRTVEVEAEREEWKLKALELQAQIDADDTADRVRAECEREYAEFMRQKEEGYAKLVRDFVRLQERSAREIKEIRDESTAAVETLEMHLAGSQRELARQKEESSGRIIKLEGEKYALLQQLVEQNRQLEAAKNFASSAGEDMTKQIEALKEALEEAAEERRQAFAEVEAIASAEDAEKRGLHVRIGLLQKELERVQKHCAEALLVKQQEVQQALAGISEARKEIDVERQKRKDMAEDFERKVRLKEEAYDALMGENQVLLRKLKRAEEYAEEIWAKVRAKEREILAQARKYEKLLEEAHWRYEELERAKKEIALQIAELQQQLEEQRLYYEDLMREEKAVYIETEQGLREEIAELKQTVKEKQQEIFDLMEEMRRKEEEWERQKAELEMVIKEKERELDQLRTEMKFRIEQLQAEIDELTESYDLLKRKYDADLTGDNSVASLRQTVERLMRQIRELQAKLEQLQAKIKEMRKIIREKDFLIEDIKRECADIVMEKEAAYDALLKDMNKIREEFDAEKKKFRDMAYKMGKEIKKVKDKYNGMLHDLEHALAEEKKKDLVRQKLYDEIEEWKQKLHEEVEANVQRRKDLTDMIAIKEAGIQSLIKDNTHSLATIDELRKELAEVEQTWQKKLDTQERLMTEERYQFGKKCKEYEEEYEKVLYALNDPEKVKKEKERLKKEQEIKQKLMAKIARDEVEIAAAQAAVKEIAMENTSLRELVGDRKAELEKDKLELERKLVLEAKRFKRMQAENEDLRGVLLEEMDKAEATLVALETQFLQMPNPFLDEVVDLRAKIEDCHRAMKVMSAENDELRAETTKVRLQAVETQKELTHKLEFATDMLAKVKTMESLQLIGNPEFFNMLDKDGDGDVTIEEALPILIAQGMSEEQARAAFAEIDKSGDGIISAEEFQAFREERGM